MTQYRRRDVVAGVAAVLLHQAAARAGIIAGRLPWAPTPPLTPPPPDGTWQYFNATEAAMVEMLADRIIPPDAQTPGGRDAGCAVFIDRQLAGPYGHAEGLYNQGPFLKGSEQQGPQSPDGPAAAYRKALATLERYCQTRSGKSWVDLDASSQDAILHQLEGGSLALEGVDGKLFFQQLLKDVQAGFFADPIYGGNRDMCGWKMIGFPGARYDYRDWVERHNERYPYPPVSIAGRPDWTPRG
jgi:gluconate 2-dehydrogenase gamma chain